MFINGIIAVIIAYLLGSISWSYIITKLYTGHDIRKLGGKNAGTLNVLREVGLLGAFIVALFDIGKGAAAVFIALAILNVPPLFWPAAGLAVVAGHLWPVFLRFKGGSGLAPTLGVLAVLMPWDLMIALAIAVLIMIYSRNPVLSINISLLTIPFTAWFLEQSLPLLAFSLLLALILILHYLPTAKAALAAAGSRENLATELFRLNRSKKKVKQVKKAGK